MQVIRYEKELYSQWNFFVGAANGPISFMRDFIEERNITFDDQSLIALRGKKIIGVFPGNRVGETLWSHQGLPLGGWLVHSSVTGSEMITLFDLLIRSLETSGIGELVYKSIPRLHIDQPREEDLFELVRRGGVLVERDMVFALTPTRMEKFSSDRAGNVDRARKAGMRIEEYSDFNHWQSLLSQILDDDADSPYPGIGLSLAKAVFREKLRIFGCIQDSETVLLALIADNGQTAEVLHYTSIATDDNGDTVDFLFSELTSKQFSERDYFIFGSTVRHPWGLGASSFVRDVYQLSLS